MKFRSVVFFKDHFEEFFCRQKKKVKEKIIWTLSLIEEQEVVPEKYLKHLEGTSGLYEVRVQSGREIFRLFAFFDKDRLVVVLNGFQKKSDKTPKNEIAKALKIKDEYENGE